MEGCDPNPQRREVTAVLHEAKKKLGFFVLFTSPCPCLQYPLPFRLCESHGAQLWGQQAQTLFHCTFNRSLKKLSLSSSFCLLCTPPKFPFPNQIRLLTSRLFLWLLNCVESYNWVIKQTLPCCSTYQNIRNK